MRPQARGLFHKVSTSEAKVVCLHHVNIRTSVHVHRVLDKCDHLRLHNILSRCLLLGFGRWGECFTAVNHKDHHTHLV